MKTIKVTKAQLLAIVHLASDIEAMIGCADEQGETDKLWKRRVKTIDRMLAANGFQRRKPGN